MKIQNAIAPLSTLLNTQVPAALAQSTHGLSDMLKNAISTEISSLLSPGMLPQQRSDLLETLKQSITEQVSAHVHVALNNGGSSQKTQGAAWTLGGAVMQGLGQRLGSSGGMAAKAVGLGLTVGGRVAEEIGKDKFSSSGSSASTGGLNAFSGVHTRLIHDAKK